MTSLNLTVSVQIQNTGVSAPPHVDLRDTVPSTAVLRYKTHLGSRLCAHVCVLSHFSCAQLFAILWAVAHQAPLSMGFSRHEYWSGLPCLPPGDLSYPEIGLRSLLSPALAGRFFTTRATWEALDFSPVRLILGL